MLQDHLEEKLNQILRQKETEIADLKARHQSELSKVSATQAVRSQGILCALCLYHHLYIHM